METGGTDKSPASRAPLAGPKRGRGRPRNFDAATSSLGTVLNLVRSRKAETRQELERESELGRAVVTDRLSTLTGLGLIDDTELGAANGGRAPRLLRFRPDRACILVAVLDQTALGVGIADLAGRLLMEHHEATELAAGPRAVAERLATLFDWFLEKSQQGRDVWGIGVAAPGPAPYGGPDPFAQAVGPLVAAWEDYPFAEHLTARFGAPVLVRSNVETVTMGELSAGAGAGSSNMIYVKIGKRIGAGIMVDGGLYRGSQGAAGLIGQVSVEAEGSASTLEALAGSDALAARGTEGARSGASPLLAELLGRNGGISAIDVGQAAQMGDAYCIEVMSSAGKHVGRVVAMLVNLLNPSLVVLGGSVAQTNDILLAAVREAVYRDSHPLVTRDLKILRSQMGSSASLIGSAMVVVESLFAPETLKGWVARGSALQHPAMAGVRRRAQDALTAHRSPAVPPAGLPA